LSAIEKSSHVVACAPGICTHALKVIAFSAWIEEFCSLGAQSLVVIIAAKFEGQIGPEFDQEGFAVDIETWGAKLFGPHNLWGR
jgi:hypothetical protein